MAVRPPKPATSAGPGREWKWDSKKKRWVAERKTATVTIAPGAGSAAGGPMALSNTGQVVVGAPVAGVTYPTFSPTTGAGTTTGASPTPSTTRKLTIEEILADPALMGAIDKQLAPLLSGVFGTSGLTYSPTGEPGRAATVRELFQNPGALSLTVGGKTIGSGVEAWDQLAGLAAGDVSSGITGTTLGDLINAARRASIQAAEARSASGVSGGEGVAGAEREIGRKLQQGGYSKFLQDFVASIANIGTQRSAGAQDVLKTLADAAVPGTTTVETGTGTGGGGGGGGAATSWKPADVKPNTPGANMPVAERAAYTKLGDPKGSGRPKDPKPGDTFKSSGGVFFVYKSKPKPGWYKK